MANCGLSLKFRRHINLFSLQSGFSSNSCFSAFVVVRRCSLVICLPLIFIDREEFCCFVVVVVLFVCFGRGWGGKRCVCVHAYARWRSCMRTDCGVPSAENSLRVYPLAEKWCTLFGELFAVYPWRISACVVPSGHRVFGEVYPLRRCILRGAIPFASVGVPFI